MRKKSNVKAPVARAQKTAEVKAEVKTEAVETVKEETAKTPVTEETKNTEVKKEESVKKPEKEAVVAVKEAKPKAAKKTPAKEKKASAKKVAAVPEVFVQYSDNGEQEARVADIVEKVKALYVAQGHRESSIKSLQIYMKPQEWKAYYVINGKISGDMDLF